MELIGLLASLVLTGIIICVLCYGLFVAVVTLIEFYEVVRYPFMRLRCVVAGAEDRFAPLGRLFVAALVSKLVAALIVAAIALYLGASVKATAIAAALAFVFLG